MSHALASAQSLDQPEPVSLVFQATPEHAPFLELLVVHATQQFGPAIKERLIVLDTGSPRHVKGRRRAVAASLETLAEDLVARGLVDRVLDGCLSRDDRDELVDRYCERASRPLLKRYSGAEAIWSGLHGLTQAAHDHVLHITGPVFFHCSGPSWLEAALEELHRRPELWMLVASSGPPATEDPPGDADAVHGFGPARSCRQLRPSETTGYFLCDRRRLIERLGWNASWRGMPSFEQWLSRGRGTRGELRCQGAWAVRPSYTKKPFPEWAPAMARAVAGGAYPKEQRGRYDIRLDRALDRDAWVGLLGATTESQGRAELERRRQSNYSWPCVRDVPAPLKSALDFVPKKHTAALNAPRSVILAPYFTKNGNPIYGRERYRKDRHELIQPWWSDVNRLGLHARIFHDGLSAKFMARYTTNQIQFERAEIPRGVSCNDYRFVVFRDWLREHTQVEYVFCTDMFDLRVNRDPFEVVAGGHWIYAGSQLDRIGGNLYVRSKLHSAYGCSFPDLADKIVLNAGILGGPRDLLLTCLDSMVHDLLVAIRRNPTGNHNMGVFNRVLYSMDRVWAHGAPLHSEFRAQDKKADVCFVHK